MRHGLGIGLCGSGRWRGLVALAVTVGVALPGVAQAHGGSPVLSASVTAGTPVIDGTIAAEEWAGSTTYNFSFGGSRPFTVRAVRDSTYLYIAAQVTDSSPVNPGFSLYVDDNHDGAKATGDDVISAYAGAANAQGNNDFFWHPDGTCCDAPSPPAPSHYPDTYDTSPAGTLDVLGAGSADANGATFEIRHPLCSSDVAHDFCVSQGIGGTLGVNFQYQAASTPFVRYPSASATVPSDWADLAIAAGDAVAPTVNVTAPAAGSVLRGTVAVAATASDNVGIQRVDFKYDPGSGSLVNIGSDPTFPYETTFDSTAFPNTVRGGATVYAFAYDAAGNETGVGNGVMVDNPASLIVFGTDRDGNSEIYRMEPNGNDGITRLTADPVVDSRPSLSPDLTKIAWQRAGQVWVMNSDGTLPQQLVTLGTNGGPSFSPDGSKIAFESNRSGNFDIWVMDADGSNQVNLTNAPGDDLNATWSPDGANLAFDSNRNGNRDVFRMTSGGAGQTNLTSNPALDVDPDWSPDGSTILFASDRGGVSSVWRMSSADGSSAVNLTNATISDGEPAWSPTGDRIVFSRTESDGEQHLHTDTVPATGAFTAAITFSVQQPNGVADWGAVVAGSAQPGPTFTVTTADDHDDGACTPSDCTLREAIGAANTEANADGPDEIDFAIAGIGLQAITLDSTLGALPDVTEPVVIDGTTQPGFDAEPMIFLDGSALVCIECYSDGITVESAGSGTTIRGLAIGNFDGVGILLDGGDNVVEGTWIGIKPPGPFNAAGNESGGISIGNSSGNRIGGPLPEQRVVLGSNGNFGGGQIEITGFSSGNVVQGSYIGLGPDGEYSYDTEDGVYITGGASGNTIGGDSTAGEGNVVYGFYGRGIVLDGAGSDNVVAGNTIGLSEGGSPAEAPDIGIDVDSSPDTDVGDSVSPPGFANPARGNVVLGAATAGIRVQGASAGTRVAGNFVGVHRTIESTDYGNGIGVSVPLGSGITLGPGNTIAYNTSNGVEIDNEGSSGNRIVANSIHDNGGLGIALLSFANNGIPAPAIGSATTTGGNTTIESTLTTTEGTYFVEFFASDTCDGSGAGEGETYLGATTVSVGAAPEPFTHAVGSLPVGTVVTATTTSAVAGDTSVFSTCATVTLATVTLEPVADTYVSGSQPTTSFGTAGYFDTYGGFSASCVPHSAPAYGLLRFDLSSLPAGEITDAKIVLTSRAGYAQDGDPNHHAIFLADDSWTDAVTWNGRPSDGTVAAGDPTLAGGGGDIRVSNRALGADFVWRGSCNTDFAGDEKKVFPTNSDTVKTFAAAQTDMIGAVVRERDGDDLLSVEIYNPNCPSCPGGANKAYWARYYSTESENADVRPKLVVTYAAAASVAVTSFTATPSNPSAYTQIATSAVPTAVLLSPPRNTESAPLGDTPLGDTPLGDTPLGDTPLGDTPLGDTPLGDTSLGLDDVLTQLRTVPLSSLPLLREGGWPAVLPPELAARALQNVTLGDVLGYTPRLSVLDGQGTDDILLEELDFSRSSLGDVVTIAYALGSGVTLSELSGAFTNGQLDPALQQWCTLTNTSCTTSSILALGLQGAPLGDTPLGDTPLGDTPLGDTPLGDTPLGDTPLGDTPLGDTPLGDTPLGDTPLADTPLGDTPLSDTDVSRAPLGDTPLGDTPLGDTDLTGAPLGDTPLGDTRISNLQNCTAIFVSCPPTGDKINQHLNELRQNATLTMLLAQLTVTFKEGLTVAQLLAVLDPPSDYTIAQVAAIFTEASGVTLADLVASLPNPNDFTLNDLLIAVLRAGAQWERIDLNQPTLARFAAGGGTVELRAALTVSGFMSSPLTITVDLPRGWTSTDSVPWIEGLPEGPATVLESVGVASTEDGGTRHTLRTQFAVSGDQRIHFQAKPGAILGLASASIAAVAAGSDPVATAVDVQEAFEPANNDPTSAPMLVSDTLYVSHLASAADADYYKVSVPPTGTRTTIRLSHLPKDYDLVVYGRQGTTQLVPPGDAPPLETPVLGDSGATITHLTDSLPAETLDDLTFLPDRPVLGVSAFRTTEDEAVVAISDGEPGDYVIQVTGYNGATSVQPYMLRVETETPRLAPACVPRYPGLSFGSAGGVSLPSIPTDVDTVFLANGPQLAATGGQAVLDWFSTANLGALRTTGHPSALVRLEQDPGVRAAYAAWNAQPCSTARANAIVRAITDALRVIRAARPSLKNVVLLGSDTAIPFARLDDLTTIANEADYASTFGRADDLYGALNEHRVLSDDPYGTTDPIPYLQRQLFVPQHAVGRLVETPGQITGALDRFLAFGGVLDPTSARTSGYDFLKDGATGVAAAFAAVVGAQQAATNPPLIGDLWTRSTLAGSLGTSTGLFGMNGHADHFRLQPAAGADLFSAADLPASLARAVVFSMGCHSGLSASDVSVAGAIAGDWPQAFAGRGTAAYVGNLGYGYGDTVTVAYSEALNVRLAEALRDGLPIGEALVEAKQAYLADLGIVGVYDEKAMAELALYGLPMWSLGGAAAPLAGSSETAQAKETSAAAAGERTSAVTAAALPTGVTRTATETDPVTGLLVDRYRAEPALAQRTVAGPSGGRYWEGPSGVQVTHLRPIQPKAQFEVAEDAHGVLVTGLQSNDLSPVDPVYARPIVDSSAAEPELPFADVAFPAKIQTLVSQRTRTGRRVSAVLVHGQFFSDQTADVNGAGVQRLFTRVDLDVLRSAGIDRLAPRFDSIEAVVLDTANLVSFSVDAVDLPGGSADDVVRVLVAFRDETSPTWRFLDLARGAGSAWGGGASVAGTQVEYFVQAVDRAGNVAASTNKGLLFAGAPEPALPPAVGVEPTVTPSVGGTRTAGWFTPAAVLDVDAEAGIAVAVSIDGGPFAPFTGPVTISEDGLHTLRVRGSNGYEATLLAPVDTLAPTVVLDQPGATVSLNGKVALAFRCADTASGVDTCTATVDGTPRTAGFEVPATPLNSTHTIVLTATDRVGRVTTRTFTYTVRSRSILYTSSATGAGDVYTLPVDAGPTTAPTRLTATSFPEADPVWSSGADRIAFSSNRDGTWRIYLMDADGTDVTLLPTGTGDATEPAWSPDGSRIAFVSMRTGNPDVWVVNVNTLALSRLTTDSKLDVAPTWSPLATNRIAWANGPGGQLDIWTMTPTGGGKTRLTSTEDLNTDPSWRSDGTIAFARRAKGGPRFEIWTMTSAGKSRVRIISSLRNDTQPSWLQDGRLVFATDRDDERDFDLFRATKTGSSWPQVRITNAAGDDRGPSG